MILLDAYALVAFVGGGPAEPETRRLLRSGSCAIPTINLAEVLDVLERTRSIPPNRVQAAIDPLFETLVEPIPLTVELARAAGSLRAAHYHRLARPLSLADCVLLASGAPGDRVATADPDVLAVAPGLGLEAVALPPEQ